MASIRVAVFGLSNILVDLIRENASARSKIQVNMCAGVWSDLLDSVARDELDVVILGCKYYELDNLAADLLKRNARLKVLGLTGDERELSVYELLPHLRRLENCSMNGIFEAIEETPAWSA